MLSNLSLHCTWLFVKVNIFSSIADGGDFWAPATFERLDLRFGAGRWLAVGREVGLVQKVWGAAHKCNRSLGIFTWGLINMPLKHSRHICPTEQRQRQIVMIRNFFHYSSGFFTSSWQTRYQDVLDVWLWCELIKRSFPAIFKRPDWIKTETVVLELTKGTIKI